MVDAVGRNGDNCTYQKLNSFVSYLRSFWLPLANILSVFGQPWRTNNTSENFNLIANRIIGDRPGFWKMLGVFVKNVFVCNLKFLIKWSNNVFTFYIDHLKKIMERKASDYIAVSAGATLNNTRPENDVLADLNLQALEDKLEKNE